MSVWSPTVENVENGNVAVSNFPAVQPVSDNSSSLTVDAVALDIRHLTAGTDSVSVSGTVSTSTASSASATVTNTSVGPTVVTLLAANASRIKAIIHNESGTLYVKFGSGATFASYTYRLVANTVLEISQYTGSITAIKASGTSAVLTTEL
jgi:hypothetical protein